MVKGVETKRKLPEPLYGEPGELPIELVKSLIERQAKHGSDARKYLQSQRDRILKSKHGPDIDHRIDTQYETPELAEMVKAHRTTVANPPADIVQGVVQVYRGGAVRRIEGATDEQQKAFQQIVAETGITANGQDIARSAFMVGCKFAAPIVRRGRMRLLTPAPYQTDIVLDAEDPTGDPVALAFGASSGLTGVLDGESLRFFRTERGRAVEQTDLAVPHGVGDMPAAPLRFTEVPEPSDWWDHEMHERLRQGAIEVGVLIARLGLTRHIQGGKQLAFAGDMAAIAKGQPIGHPAAPVVANITDASRGVDITALDFDTSPKNTLEHVRAIIEWMARDTKVPVTVAPGGDSLAMSWDHDALAELRQAMLWWVLQFERQLWTFAVKIAIAQRHPLAKELPPPEMVESAFVLELPPLHLRFADPIAELKWWAEMRGAGQADYLDMCRRYHPGLDDEMLKAQLFSRIDFNGEIWRLLSVHQQPSSADSEDTTARPMRGLAEEQGATGGRPPNEPSDDGDEALDRAS